MEKIICCLSQGRFVLIFMTLMILPGCMGRSVDYPETVPVTGFVFLDGQPLKDATITFVPVAGRASSGKTDALGRYSLSYTNTIEGAILGEHRVMIRKSVIDNSFVPTSEEIQADSAQNEFLEATGIPSQIGATEGLVMTQGAKTKQSMPLKPVLKSLVAKRFNGPESLLFAIVADENNIFDFAVTGD